MNTGVLRGYTEYMAECLSVADAQATARKDRELVSKAQLRVGAYPEPTQDILRNWLLPALRGVAVEASSVRVRREGMAAADTAYDLLARLGREGSPSPYPNNGRDS